MTKKLKTLLSLGLVTVATATAIVPANAQSRVKYSKTNYKGVLYVYVNGVKHKLVFGSNCDQNNSGNIDKPNTTPDNNENNSGDTNKPNTTPDNNENNSGDTNKPNTTPDNNQSTGSFASYQKEVLDLVNAERTKRGLSALTLNTKLSNVATTKSQDMINRNYFDHNSPTYGSPFDMMKQFGISYRSAGENIAMGQSTPQEVMNSWMNSSGHRKNILSSDFKELGVGIAKDSNGRLYWTQMFIG